MSRPQVPGLRCWAVSQCDVTRESRVLRAATTRGHDVGKGALTEPPGSCTVHPAPASSPGSNNCVRSCGWSCWAPISLPRVPSCAAGLQRPAGANWIEGLCPSIMLDAAGLPGACLLHRAFPLCCQSQWEPASPHNPCTSVFSPVSQGRSPPSPRRSKWPPCSLQARRVKGRLLGQVNSCTKPQDFIPLMATYGVSCDPVVDTWVPPPWSLEEEAFLSEPCRSRTERCGSSQGAAPSGSWGGVSL